MTKFTLLLVFPLFNLTSLPYLGHAQSSCNSPCQTLNNYKANLVCVDRQCKDDPNAKTQICSESSSFHPLPCKQTSTVKCQGQSYPTYKCSPPISSSTPAKLTYKDFTKGRPLKCDGKFCSNKDPIIALLTSWYNGGSRCTAKNGKRVVAKVVDECGLSRNCDKENNYESPCKNNIVDGSDAVWKALGLNKEKGEADVFWSIIA
ncbi:kiwellin-like [Camellia sinensis]|uniref:Uncharacterized protein n=1 Tax=Camellia sinensis var. sinensis TaxID=542762 RepID=A0A4S4DXG0_CAMSN|nr:kiwellin-like [Camellia sinensis]THG08070.1 hypothetical protein TEA_028426 [Camellia sinensis var. sinensis]